MLQTRQQIQATMAQIVHMSTANAIDDLTILVDEAEIRLSGTANSYYVKQLATQAALSASEGRAVRNDIHVNVH